MEQENNSSNEGDVEEFAIVEYDEMIEEIEVNEIEDIVETDSEYQSAEENDDLLSVEASDRKNVTFDITLPSTHSYLCQDWDELSGRTVHNDGAIISIPILSFPGVVLMPGQQLPLHLFRDADLAMIKYCLEGDKTFGQLNILRVPASDGYTHTLAPVGTTVEILAVKEEENMNMKVKTLGRQRFEVLNKKNGAGGHIVATVRILPDKNLPDPLSSLHHPIPYPYLQCNIFSASSSQYNDNNFNCKEHCGNSDILDKRKNDDNDTLINNNLLENSHLENEEINKYSDADVIDVIETHLKGSDAIKTKINLKKTKKPHMHSPAVLTHWPEWVYNQYNCEILMQHIRHEMRAWNDKMVSTTVPQDPENFSYWIASSLPLDDAMRLELLRIDSCQQRLRFELSIIRKCTVMCCNRCNQMVARKDDVFSMSTVGPLGTYVNPGGHVHETLTVYQVFGVHHFGKPSTDASWFPGYAWTIVECSTCHKHMGWRFTLAKKDPSVKPQRFWGLCRTGLVPGLINNEPTNY